jgi:hypothetical protein
MNEANELSAQGQIEWSFKQQRQAGVLEKRTHLSHRTPLRGRQLFPVLSAERGARAGGSGLRLLGGDLTGSVLGEGTVISDRSEVKTDRHRGMRCERLSTVSATNAHSVAPDQNRKSLVC